MMNRNGAAHDRKIFVVCRAQPAFQGGHSNKEIKSILFAVEDEFLANTEVDRLNDERTAQERHTEGIYYKVESLPMLSRRKTRHPFMRGQNQRNVYNPDLHEKNGNVDENWNKPRVEVKTRGRLHRRDEQPCGLLSTNQ